MAFFLLLLVTSLGPKTLIFQAKVGSEPSNELLALSDGVVVVDIVLGLQMSV